MGDRDAVEHHFHGGLFARGGLELGAQLRPRDNDGQFGRDNGSPDPFHLQGQTGEAQCHPVFCLRRTPSEEEPKGLTGESRQLHLTTPDSI